MIDPQQNIANDPLAQSPAGMSLTQENKNYPWGNPSKYSDPDEALSKALDSLEDPANEQNLIKLLFAGVSVESIVEGYIYDGFESGRFSLDTGLLMKAPLAIYISDIAEEKSIPYRLFENDDTLERDEIPDQNILAVMKENNPKMFEYLSEHVGMVARLGTLAEKPDIEKPFIEQGETE